MNMSNEEDDKLFNPGQIKTELQFRAFSFEDFRKFNEINNLSIPEYEKVMRIPHSHINSPSFDYEYFAANSYPYLKALGQDFLTANFQTKLFVDKNEDFYNFSLQVINAQQKKLSSFVQTSFEPMLRLNQDFIENINRVTVPLLMSHIKSIEPLIANLNNSLSEIYRTVIFQNLDIYDNLVNISNILSKINLEIAELMENQLSNFINWIDNHDEIFNSFHKFLGYFEEKYKITEEQAIKILGEYNWLITPSLPYSLLLEIVEIDGESTNHKLKKINAIFLNYFKENNWENLNNMIERWKGIPLFRDRMKIIRDCVNIIKIYNGQKVNVANFVIPTLICQIDGLISDYIEYEIGVSWDNDSRGWTDPKTKELLKDSNGKKIKREEIIKMQKSEALSDELFYKIILDILFSKAYRGKPPASNLQFNRHKIIHGENKHYGRWDYLIRLFLILDFVAYIINP